MDTIVCPKCGTENPDDAVNCKECRINLNFALNNPAEIERIKQDEARREQYEGLNIKGDGKVQWWIKYLVLGIAFVIVYIWAMNLGEFTGIYFAFGVVPLGILAVIFLAYDIIRIIKTRFFD